MKKTRNIVLDLKLLFSRFIDVSSNCNGLYWPGGVYGEPELDDVEADILVERVQDQLTDAGVVPRAVYQQQAQEKTELITKVLYQ